MLDTLRRLTTERHAADAAWRAAVVEACETNTMRSVAEAAGITAGRVAQIVREERDRNA